MSTSKKLPDWLSNKKKRSLRKDEEFRRRVELVQDLSFPSACTTLKASQDGEYLFAAGLHAPQVCIPPWALAIGLAVSGERHQPLVGGGEWGEGSIGQRSSFLSQQ